MKEKLTMSPAKIKKRLEELNFILDTDALVEMIKLGQEAESLNAKSEDFKRGEYYLKRIGELETRRKELERLTHRKWDKPKLRAERLALLQMQLERQYLECEQYLKL